MTICLFPEASLPMVLKREAPSHSGKEFDDAKVLACRKGLK